ncbi:UDP-N-acetylmuramoyl-L-alanine--D-glutamate ligase [Nitratifractor salsuginis]|uniref:UDP-N-acetylmuramoylalanine--D-glutamate ligase n=1 Tax=Nitratifractor salsuginis (strain DSM 16511 / JCM 12458 / E9I37-1) TaxID=749222 RepID=E6X0N6_NITSE|nr:UDP-N-acetylmuramoyl-L-alanine--D-glutamate ligase [Nitratifractor salsuginis]ADV45756.1 UDP-N-acetylmuramoylalanine/D-glutamate ligase [Nitratifractor salsuginis DSM 16511]
MHLSFFGYGKTTRAIAARFGGGFDFYDDRCEKPYVDEAGNRIHPSRDFAPEQSALEILTPSIRPDSPLLAKARNPISEYDLFLSRKWIETLSEEQRRHLPSSIFNLLPKTPPRTVWISGTNGKTTTTQMLTWLLEPHGALSGGNIGTPLADLDPEAPLWILETSSYTLHHTRYASPDLYLLLPITPDHIDWHGSPEAYTADKLAPLRTMREGELALIPAGLPRPSSAAWVVEYDSNAYLESFFDLDASRLRYRAGFLQDALLALAVSRTLFDEADYDQLDAFRLDRHRQEEILDARGRLWVNDSKATNLDAALQALEAYADRPIHLIAGGDDKGVDMTPLIRCLARLDAKLYTIGSNNRRLSQLARDYGVPVQSFTHLDEALQAVDRALKPSEVALLSPAAASLDQFPSYAHRGDALVDYVKKIEID